MGGFVADGFGAVVDTFRRLVAEPAAVGLTVAVYRAGEPVVDLWGGWADRKRTRAWQRDTLAAVYSTTKGMTATAVAVAHSRGYLDYDAPVSHYWPQFAANGKAAISVRTLLAHQAGLAATRGRLDPRIMADHDRLATLMARQRPDWEPGTRHGYHVMSLGFYIQELMRRTDPQGRSVGRFFAEEVARPLGMDAYIGLPDSVPDSRLAEVRAAGLRDLADRNGMARGLRPSSLPGTLGSLRSPQSLRALRPGSVQLRAITNPRLAGAGSLLRREYLRVEFPTSNAVATARSIARMYGDLARQGPQLGLSTSTFAELTATAPVVGDGMDVVLGSPTRYALGYSKPSPALAFGLSHRAFGAPGMGGSFGFADPDAGIGYCFIPTRHSTGVNGDARERALREAVYACL